MAKSLKKNALLNTIKTLCQVIFPIITIPYISRTLGTDSYGKVNFTASIIGYFALFAAFGITNYATREGARIRDHKSDLKKLTNELYAVNIFTSVISIVVLLLVVFAFHFNYDYKLLLIVQGAAIIFTALGADWVCSIFEDYTYIAVRYIIFQILSLILLFIFVKTSNDFVVYAAILTIASSGANLLNVFYIRKYVKLRPTFTRGCLKHIKPMLILLGFSFAITIYIHSGTTLLGIYKDDYDVGIYSLAAKIYLVIKQVLNAGIIVTLPRIASILGREDKNEYKSLLTKVFNFLILLVFPSIVGIFMLSGDIIYLAGGDKYMLASFPLQILSVSLAFAVFGCFFANCFLLPNKRDKDMLYATIVGCCVNVLFNLVLIPYCSYIGTSIATLVAEFFVCWLCYWKSRQIGELNINIRNVISVIIGGGVIILICHLSSLFISNILMRVFVAVTGSILLYFASLVLFRNSFVMEYLYKIMSYFRTNKFSS